MNILIVDDDVAIRRVLRLALEKMEGGHTVEEAADGAAALERVERFLPDLILLDRNMGLLDGMEVCTRLRANRAYSSIYIILLTACSEVESKVDALDAGADDYVVKPFNLQELMARVRRGLKIAGERRSADTDFLTGLPNRRAFQAALEREADTARRYGHPLSLLLIDADHFKRVNDAHGHDAGDAVLRDIAAIMRRECRQCDFPARWGGEEFILLLPATDGASALQFAERVRCGMEEHDFPCVGRQTISIGAAVFQGDALAMINEADGALYQAKKDGRNRAVLAGGADGAPDAG